MEKTSELLQNKFYEAVQGTMRINVNCPDKTGFPKCGTYPLDRNAVNKSRFSQYQVYSAATPNTPSSSTLSDTISAPPPITEN